MYLLFVIGSLLSDFLEDGDNKLLRNVASSVRIYASWYISSLQSSGPKLRRPRVSNIHVQVGRLRWTTKCVSIARNLRWMVGLLFRNLRLEFVRQRRWNRLLGKWLGVPLQVAALSHNNADLQNMFVLFSAPPPLSPLPPGHRDLTFLLFR